MVSFLLVSARRSVNLNALRCTLLASLLSRCELDQKSDSMLRRADERRESSLFNKSRAFSSSQFAIFGKARA